MADVVTSQRESVASATPAWVAASRKYTAAPQLGAESRKYAVEAIGTFFLVFTVAASVLSHSTFTPLAAGAVLMVMVSAGGHISGGHYTPAVPLAALWRGRIGPVDAVAYWIVQFAAGAVAAVVARAGVDPAAVPAPDPAA